MNLVKVNNIKIGQRYRFVTDPIDLLYEVTDIGYGKRTIISMSEPLIIKLCKVYNSNYERYSPSFDYKVEDFVYGLDVNYWILV